MKFLLTVYTELPADEARDELVVIFQESEAVHLVAARLIEENTEPTGVRSCQVDRGPEFERLGS